MSRKQDLLQTLALVPSPTHERPNLHSLQYAQPSSVQLRDGDVVVFRRADSPLWQFRYRSVIIWHKSYYLSNDFLHYQISNYRNEHCVCRKESEGKTKGS